MCVHGKGPRGAHAVPSAPQRTLDPPNKPNSQSVAADGHTVLQRVGKKDTHPVCRCSLLPQPSPTPEEGEIPFHSSAERNLASTLMERDPGVLRTPNAAAARPAPCKAPRGWGRLTSHFKQREKSNFSNAFGGSRSLKTISNDPQEICKASAQPQCHMQGVLVSITIICMGTGRKKHIRCAWEQQPPGLSPPKPRVRLRVRSTDPPHTPSYSSTDKSKGLYASVPFKNRKSSIVVARGLQGSA